MLRLSRPVTAAKTRGVRVESEGNETRRNVDFPSAKITQGLKLIVCKSSRDAKRVTGVAACWTCFLCFTRLSSLTCLRNATREIVPVIRVIYCIRKYNFYVFHVSSRGLHWMDPSMPLEKERKKEKKRRMNLTRIDEKIEGVIRKLRYLMRRINRE